jgi:hypothetical protein
MHLQAECRKAGCDPTVLPRSLHACTGTTLERYDLAVLPGVMQPCS